MTTERQTLFTADDSHCRRRERRFHSLVINGRL